MNDWDLWFLLCISQRCIMFAFPLFTVLLKMNRWVSVPVSVPLSSAECDLPSVQFKVYSCSFPLWASFSSSLPPFPLLAFPFIIIAKVCVPVVWCLLHHVPLVSFTTRHRWVCPVTVDWKCVSVASEQNHHRKSYRHTHTAQPDFRRMVMNDADWNCLYLSSFIWWPFILGLKHFV